MFCIILCSQSVWNQNPSPNLNPSPAVEMSHNGLRLSTEMTTTHTNKHRQTHKERNTQTHVHLHTVVLTDDLGARGVVLMVVVDGVDVELSGEHGALGDVLQPRVRPVRHPHVELGQPVL